MEPDSSQNCFTAYRFAILLTIFLLQLLTTPLFEGSMAAGYAADIFFYLLLAAAAFSIRNSRFFKLAIFLGIVAIACEITSYFSGSVIILIITGFVANTYLVLVTLLLAASVARQRSINADTVMGGLCVYVLIGIFWTSIFINLELIHPGSFNFGVHSQQHLDILSIYGLLMYYSFVTLMTIGYGDVVPMSSMAQTLTILEGLIGQFYLIFFMASLVGLYIQKHQNKDSV